MAEDSKDQARHRTDAYVFLNLKHPLCAWATYRCALVTPPSERGFVSVWTASVLENDTQQALNRELSLEAVRQRNFPSRISRLRGLFCFLDPQSAEKALSWGHHFQRSNLTDLSLAEAGAACDRLDANWISFGDRDQHGGILERDCLRYWSGDPYPGEPPIWETLVEGRAYVLGTDIRKRAYSIIKSDFPDSLCFLEIGRLAAWVGSDLGNISAFLREEGSDVELGYAMDMRDAENPVFLKRLEELMSSGHPVNRADIDPFISRGTFGKTPDLRRFGFRIQKASLTGR